MDFEERFDWNMNDDHDDNSWSQDNHRHTVKCNALHCNDPNSHMLSAYSLRVVCYVFTSLSLSVGAQCAQYMESDDGRRRKVDNQRRLGDVANGSGGRSIWIYIGF